MSKPIQVIEIEDLIDLKLDLNDYGMEGEDLVMINLQSKCKNIQIDFLKKYPTLKTLHLGFNNFTDEDIKPLQYLENLEQLFLNANHNITDITPLKNLKKLHNLFLNVNNIVDISPLAELSSLKNLSIGTNKVKDVSSFRNLTNLIWLDIRDNEIDDISFVKYLPYLKYLLAQNNSINKINEGILENKEYIVWYGFIGNLIEVIEEKYYRKTNELILNGIKFHGQFSEVIRFVKIHNHKDKTNGAELTENHGNDLTQIIDLYWINSLYGNLLLIEPSYNIFLRNSVAVNEYFDSLKRGKKESKQVKVLVLGDGDSGKTTLIKRLTGQEIDQSEPQTDGIVIEKEVFEDIKINYWDFGGQEVQHNTHQFFLTENSVYILVLDNRKEEQPDYWLEYIKSFGANSQVIIVSNKIDSESHNIDKFDASFLKEKYPFIHSFHKVSSLFGNNIDFLKASLIELIKIQEFPVFGLDWLLIKDYIELETSLGKNYISYESYHDFCSERVSENVEETIIFCLKNMGLITYFQKNLNTKNYYILNPEWLTFAVYKIILSDLTISNNGSIKLNDFETILRKKLTDKPFKYSKEYEYKPSDYGFILEMMKEYELCYSIDNVNILIPSAIKISHKHEFQISNKTLIFHFDYLDFLPPAIFSRLIVRLYPNTKKNSVWRFGLVLVNVDLNCEALIKLEKRKILIYVNGDRRREYFQIIRSQIIDLNNLFPKNRVEEKIPLETILPDQYVSYDELINSELDGRFEYYHAKTRNIFEIKKLLANIEPYEQTFSVLKSRTNNNMQDNNINNIPSINVNPIITVNPVFNINTNFNKIEESKELKTMILDLEDLILKDQSWKESLISVLSEDSFRVALNEFNRLEEPEDKASQKTSLLYLERFFKKLKDIKDGVAITLLPAEVLTKFPKMLELWHIIERDLKLN